MKLRVTETRKAKLYQKARSAKDLAGKLLIMGLIGCFTLVSCRSTVMPCPKLSVSQQKGKAFSSGSNKVKYDRKGRVKK